MLQDHRGVFIYFFFSPSSSPSLNACTTLQSQQPACKCFVSLMKALMAMSDIGKQINKVNKSAMWELLSINTVHSWEWEEIAYNIADNESFYIRSKIEKLHIAASMSPSTDSMQAIWFVCLASIVFTAELFHHKHRACSLVGVTLTSGSCFSSQPLLWDCVQQKMGQAVNYHKCSGKWHFIGRSLSPIMCLLRNSQSVNVQIANPPRAQLLTECCQ